MPAQLRIVANLLIEGQLEHQARRGDGRQGQSRVGGERGYGAAESRQKIALECGAFGGGNLDGSRRDERLGGSVERLDQGDERQLHALGQVRNRGGGGMRLLTGGPGSRPLRRRPARGIFAPGTFAVGNIAGSRFDARGAIGLCRGLLRLCGLLRLHKGAAPHLVQRARPGGLPVHGLGGMLVLLLRKPAEREEAGAGRAHGVAVGGRKPELSQKLALAPLPAQRGLEE